MYTVAEAVSDLIRRSTLLEEGLRKDIINYSSLARQLRPVVSELVMKEVQIGAIIMALKRYVDRTHTRTKKLDIFQKMPDITVKSNLVEYTFANSPTLIAAQYRFFKKTHEDSQPHFLIVTRGNFETTILVSKRLNKEVLKYFKTEKQISFFDNLSAIMIKLPEITVSTPGVYSTILRSLEWEGINVIEVASTYTEFTIILQDSDIERAFATIKRTFS